MKIITRRLLNPYFVSVLAVISALIVILPQPSFAVPLQYLQPVMQQYIQSQTVNVNSIQTSASGTIFGTSSGVKPATGPAQNLAALLGLQSDVFLSSGGHFNISQPGISESLNFMTSGPAVNYSYNLPYSLSFNIPTEVTAGSRVYLNPTITWGDPLLQASQSLTYLTSQTLSADAPYDGLSPLGIALIQAADRLNVSASIPLGPFLGTYSDSFTLDSNSAWPLNDFGDGSASFFGVTNTFGGIGSIDTSGGIKTYVGDTDITVSAAPGTLTDAWYSGGDQLAFMGAIPAVGPFALGLSTVFDLEHTIDVDIQRQDRAYFQLSSLPYFDVPDNLTGSAYIPDVHMD